jgi:hypothetical protein
VRSSSVSVAFVLELCLPIPQRRTPPSALKPWYALRDRRVREARNELLQIPDTLHARDGAAERRAVPEVQVKRVVEACPLLAREQRAEGRVAERDRLARA